VVSVFVHDLPGQRCHTRAYFCNMTCIPEGDFAAVYHELALEFVAELMQVTYGADTAAAFQHALQIYVDELRPWLRERDVPETVRSTFSLFETCEEPTQTDDVRIQFSPEGDALFRAWVRRQAAAMGMTHGPEPERGH
jgi:hypothetical protein